MAARTPAGGGPSRRAFVAATLGAALLAAAACSPLTTQKPYAPSDGVRAVLGDEITIENLLVLTEAEGSPALVVGGVTNRSADTSQVTFDFAGATQTTLNVAGGDTILMPPSASQEDAGDAGLMILSTAPGAPGAVVAVTISTEASGSTTVQVPILDGTLSPYDEYIEKYLSNVDIAAS